MPVRSNVVAVAIVAAVGLPLWCEVGCEVVSGLNQIREGCSDGSCAGDDAAFADGVSSSGEEDAVTGQEDDRGRPLGDDESDANGSSGGGTDGPEPANDTGTPDVGPGADGATEAGSGDAAVEAGGGTMDATPDVGPPPVDSGPDVHDTGSPTGCAIGHLVIQEVKSRGVGGGSDEFVELYNATPSAVVLDSTWTLQARSSANTSYSVRWTGGGASIPAYGFYLIVGTSYAGATASDSVLTTGVTDATSLHLEKSSTIVDTLCYAYDSPSTTTLEGAGYGCAGTPSDNSPHDDSATGTSDVDQSLRRQQCVDTGNNAADFAKASPSTPLDSSSAPVP